MWFNITTVLGLGLTLLLTSLLCKTKYGEKILRLSALVLLIVKVIELIYMNIQFGFTFPIEISAISYYVFSIVVLFRIKKMYHIAAFFGIISGIGFFLYYSLLGYLSAFYFDMGRHFVAVFAHGVLLMGGIYLLVKNDFRNTNKRDLILMIISILAHASIFYTDSIKGTTFVYFLIRPEFLELFQLDFANHVLMVFYYVFAFSIFVYAMNKFYYINRKLIQ